MARAKRYLAWPACLLIAMAAQADGERRTLNDGNLVLYDIPPIPAEIAETLNRYQHVRSASFLDWNAGSDALYVSTRFADVPQIHVVAQPGGMRRQLTFLDEPVGSVVRRPGSNDLTFTMDAGGSEFTQIFRLDGDDGSITLQSDGESRNGALLWDRDGTRLAFQSTRRDGRANDIWIMDADDPDSAGIALAADDGSWWGPADFSADGSQLLLRNYRSITDSRAVLIDLATGEQRRVDGGEERASTNYPAGFSEDGNGIFFITDQFGEFNRLAYRDLDADADTEVITGSIELRSVRPSVRPRNRPSYM